jgi:hypothetical protein
MSKRGDKSGNSVVLGLAIFFFFFSVMMIGFVFICTDEEYNFNQQIARGYITRDALFFNIYDPSAAIARFGGWMSYGEDPEDVVFFGNVDFNVNEEGMISPDSSPIEAADPDFVLTNPVLEDGRTAMETVLGAGSGSYFASLHRGTLRGVFYHGKRSVDVPLISGRFFTEEECLAEEPLAVVGQDVYKSCYEENGHDYLDYMDKKYEVIGVTAISGASAMDSLVFINLGSIPAEEQIKGIFYIDNASSAESVFEEMNRKSEEVLRTTLTRRHTPVALIDVVSGGMYLKNYLKVFMVFLLVFFYGSILLLAIRSHKVKSAVLRLCGVSFKKFMDIFCRRSVLWAVAGIILAVLLSVFAIFFGMFSLPFALLWKIFGEFLILDILLLIVFVVISGIVEYRIDPGKVVTRI